MTFPFSEEVLNDKIFRTFSFNVDDEELTWHRDVRDRLVKIVSGEGWYLQLDEELPFILHVGACYRIPKRVWHRVLKKKGCTDLSVEITEVDSFL